MISVTALAGYLYCPRKLFLEYVLRIVPIPKKVLVLGSVRHEAHDAVNKVEESIVKGITKEIGLEEIVQKYKNEYSQILRAAILKFKPNLDKFGLDLTEVFKDTWPHFEEEAEIRAGNVQRVIEEKKVFGEELWNIMPKIKSEFRVESPKLKLKGIIDQIEFKDDIIMPFELKTGKAPANGVWPGHRIQIAAYMLMLEEAFNTPVKEGFVRYLDLKDSRKIVMNPFLKIEILELRDKVIDVLNSTSPPATCKNTNKCNACGLREACFNEQLVDEKVKEVLHRAS
jgi:CRISPR-associated protein Cas4